MSLDWTVGQLITAERLNRRLPKVAIKTATVSVASDATLNDDADLILTLVASTTYDLGGLLIINSAANAAGDFQYAWSWTQSATVLMGGFGPDVGLASGVVQTGDWGVQVADTTTPSAARSIGASTTGLAVRVKDRIIVGATDLTLTLQWAQASSNVNSTSLQINSWITATPVN